MYDNLFALCVFNINIQAYFIGISDGPFNSWGKPEETKDVPQINVKRDEMLYLEYFIMGIRLHWLSNRH